ncbi:hypothetical protein ACH5RR_009391 [Cinchona calisaya]|uniref:Uncharacterized protein n=1 Tax=Cinchona calisaya TaxID=153742 RepID=A0ABD3AEB1_9GENT
MPVSGANIRDIGLSNNGVAGLTEKAAVSTISTLCAGENFKALRKKELESWRLTWQSWKIDSGATDHIVFDISISSSYKVLKFLASIPVLPLPVSVQENEVDSDNFVTSHSPSTFAKTVEKLENLVSSDPPLHQNLILYYPMVDELVEGFGKFDLSNRELDGLSLLEEDTEIGCEKFNKCLMEGLLEKKNKEILENGSASSMNTTTQQLAEELSHPSLQTKNKLVAPQLESP